MRWEMVKLDKVCTMLSGNAWSASKFKDEGIIPIIRIQNLGNNENEKFIWWNEDYDKKFIVKKGDLLLSLSGSIKIDTWKGVDALLNQRIVKLMPNNDIDAQWFYWQITNIILDIERMGKWALVNNVSITDLKDLEIPLPPLPIQRRIAEILDAADALRRKDRELLKKYDELAQAIFIDMFGDPVKNERGWEVRKLEEMALLDKGSIRTGPFGSQLLIEELQENGIPVYGIDNVQELGFTWAKPKCITREKFKELKAFSIRKGDVLITRTGTVGRSCVAPNEIPESIIGPNLLKVSLNHNILQPVILSFLLNNYNSIKDKIKAMSPGATVAVFNSLNLKELRLCAPPIKLQNRFVEVLEYIYCQKQHLRKKHSQILFDSLLQKVFKGELVA
jgi:type I restriction enzyme S subunit